MSSGQWERTKEILEQALRLAPQERQAYLGRSVWGGCRSAPRTGVLDRFLRRGRKLIPGGRRVGSSTADPAARPFFWY